MQDKTQWYQIRFATKDVSSQRSSVNIKRDTYLNATLLDIYIKNILAENTLLEEPFIVNIFALNHKNGKFDMSLPPLLFLECAKEDTKLMTNILKKSQVNYLKVDVVSESKVEEYRLINEHVDEFVWSFAYILVKRVSDGNLLKNVEMIEFKIQEVSKRFEFEVLEVVCPNIKILKDQPGDRGPIIIYVKHKPEYNDKMGRLLANPKNLMTIPVSNYTYMVAKADAKVAERAASDDLIQSVQVKFAHGDKVIVTSGNHTGLRGTVLSQQDKEINISMNIFGQPMEFTFDINEVRLVDKDGK